MPVEVDAEAGTDLETTLEIRREGVPHPFEAGLDAAGHLGHRCRAHSITLSVPSPGTDPVPYPNPPVLFTCPRPSRRQRVRRPPHQEDEVVRVERPPHVLVGVPQ